MRLKIYIYFLSIYLRRKTQWLITSPFWLKPLGGTTLCNEFWFSKTIWYWKWYSIKTVNKHFCLYLNILIILCIRSIFNVNQSWITKQNSSNQVKHKQRCYRGNNKLTKAIKKQNFVHNLCQNVILSRDAICAHTPSLFTPSSRQHLFVFREEFIP